MGLELNQDKNQAHGIDKLKKTEDPGDHRVGETKCYKDRSGAVHVSRNLDHKGSCIFKNKSLSRNMTIGIYKTIVKPVILYACKVWIINKEEENLVAAWKRKVLRKIYRGKRVNAMQISQINQELQTLFQETNITRVTKAQRIHWLGHLMRLPQDRIPKRLLESKAEGKKRRRRPRSTWKSQIKEDIKKLAGKEKPTTRESDRGSPNKPCAY
ncbi:hypothetical protein ILUMI_03474 [Ignelater luminosus]|uniref:Uncharacterized protein n=1 Tax=Ignelater luminosus TaxID=2038154 RepID=A0A8K0GJW9_IGNLU|nr:hypothetical protein ILUMI_03474 [Ignelater luminosus]